MDSNNIFCTCIYMYIKENTFIPCYKTVVAYLICDPILKTTLEGHNFEQALTFYLGIFHRKPMKFNIQEDQLMLDIISLLPV